MTLTKTKLFQVKKITRDKQLPVADVLCAMYYGGAMLALTYKVKQGSQEKKRLDHL